MKSTLLVLGTLLAFSLGASAAGITLCPGGGSTYSTAVLFDPAWISGCSTGVNCNGTPTLFDNTASCEPTAAMDGCAVTPSCTIKTNESDLWFKWYAIATTATCVINNSGNSWLSAVQIFSQPGGTCATLVEIGCGVGSSPNATVTVPLSGLVPGQLYYMRTFGSSNVAGQRVGLMCFCGTVGLTSTPLALNLSSFSATAQNSVVNLKWTTAPGDDSRTFDIERSIDNVNFNTVTTVNAAGSSYQFNDQPSVHKVILYRIKATTNTGRIEYSKVVAVNVGGKAAFSLRSNMVSNALTIDATENMAAKIINANGSVVSNHQLKLGFNQVDISTLPNGVYFIRGEQTGDLIRFIVGR